MTAVAGIFARGGSKGLPGKNIRPLGGKPLLAYSIECALQCELLDGVFVSTDDEQIATIARQYGADVPFIRPQDLATDTSPEWLSWQHALRFFAEAGPRLFDTFVCLPATAPLRSVADVIACIELLGSSDADAVITVTPARTNPYFTMVTVDEGNAQLVIRPDPPVFRRQDAPAVYDIVPVAYVVRPGFILEANSLFEGRVKAVIVPRERAVDIDTLADFELAEFSLTKALRPDRTHRLDTCDR